jgi:hypothetical protein
VAKKWPLTSRPESPHAGEIATGYALRDFPRAHPLSTAKGKENVKTSYLLHLSTIADSKISDQPWVKFQSAGWVNIQSAPTLELDNDAIIVCAGGELPTPFLKKIGITVEARFGT